jgi:hypothetical protein
MKIQYINRQKFSTGQYLQSNHKPFQHIEYQNISSKQWQQQQFKPHSTLRFRPFAASRRPQWENQNSNSLLNVLFLLRHTSNRRLIRPSISHITPCRPVTPWRISVLRTREYQQLESQSPSNSSPPRLFVP